MPNPDRFDYDFERYTYDRENDVIIDNQTGEKYTGDGEKIDEGYDS